jgi:hypothetical protein
MTALLPVPTTLIAEHAAPPKTERKLGVVWLVISAITIGLAIQIFYGQYDPVAITWLSIAMLAALLALKEERTGSRRIIAGLLAGGLAVEFFRLISEKPMAAVLRALFSTASASLTLGVFTPRESLLAVVCLAIAAACAVGLIWPRIRAWGFAGLLAMHVLLGVVLIYSFPSPAIDVYLFERDAATALVHRHDPYSVRFHDIYWHESAKHYGPGTSVKGMLQYGYPYPPVPLLLGVPGLVAGDVRYAYLLAVTAAGFLIATMGGIRRLSRRAGMALDGVEVGAAALLLFLPSQFLVIQCGFSEPAPVLLLAATVWTALHHPRRLAIPLGLLLVCKQYMIFAVPAVWLLVPAIPTNKRWRIALETIVIGAAVSLPFAAIAGRRFWQSVVVWQFHQPFRIDALSYPALFALSFPNCPLTHHLDLLAPIAGFLSATVMLVICLKKLPRTPAGFAAAVGLILFAFFAFNKQAFCNYYYFVISAFCTAIAASNAIEPPRRQDAKNSG